MAARRNPRLPDTSCSPARTRSRRGQPDVADLGEDLQEDFPRRSELTEAQMRALLQTAQQRTEERRKSVEKQLEELLSRKHTEEDLQEGHESYHGSESPISITSDSDSDESLTDLKQSLLESYGKSKSPLEKSFQALKIKKEAPSEKRLGYMPTPP